MSLTVTRRLVDASAYTNTIDLETGSWEQNTSFFPVVHDSRTNLWSQRIDELLRIRNLNDDWDGEGTLAPDRGLVDSAILLAKYFQQNKFVPADRVLVGVNSTIYFEWYSSLGYEEIEVKDPDNAEYRRVDKETNTTETFSLYRRS